MIPATCGMTGRVCHMVAALVTALGAVVVALVAVLGTRVEARDARNRLAKDVETMLKLDPGSDARSTLERHVADSTRDLAARERLRIADRRPQRFMRLSLISAAIGLFLQTALGGSNRTSSIGYLRELAQPLSWVFIIAALVAILLSALATILDHGLRRKGKPDKKGQAGDTEDASAVAGD